MAQYYKDRLLDGVRFFEYGKEQLATFELDGKKLTVPASEVTNESYRGFQGGGDVVTDNTDKTIITTIEIDLKKDVPHDTEPEPKEEDSEVDSKDVSENVVATRLSDESETALGEIGSEEFNEFVKKHKLDVEAVQRVLDGEQKTHKGFSFTV